MRGAETIGRSHFHSQFHPDLQPSALSHPPLLQACLSVRLYFHPVPLLVSDLHSCSNIDYSLQLTGCEVSFFLWVKAVQYLWGCSVFDSVLCWPNYPNSKSEVKLLLPWLKLKQVVLGYHHSSLYVSSREWLILMLWYIYILNPSWLKDYIMFNISHISYKIFLSLFSFLSCALSVLQAYQLRVCQPPPEVPNADMLMEDGELEIGELSVYLSSLWMGQFDTGCKLESYNFPVILVLRTNCVTCGEKSKILPSWVQGLAKL